MFMDRIAALKRYMRARYTDASPLEYYEKGSAAQLIHKDTRRLLEELLNMLAEKGEDVTFAYIKNKILKTKDY